MIIGKAPEYITNEKVPFLKTLKTPNIDNKIQVLFTQTSKRLLCSGLQL